MQIYLAADMHLQPGVQHEQNTKLRLFLKKCPAGQKVFLLGDTFNCWYENQHGYAGDYAEIIDIFAEAVSAGIEINLITGNRDFVFSRGEITSSGYEHPSFQTFFNSTVSALSKAGVYLLGDYTEIEFCGKRYYLTHGDIFCTEDIWHQLLRYLLTGNPGGRFLSSFLPLSIVNLIFSLGKFYSKDAYNNIAEIPDNRKIQIEAVCPLINSGVDYIICGHLHKYMAEDIHTKQHSGKLIILPCWASGDYACIDCRDFQIKNISCS